MGKYGQMKPAVFLDRDGVLNEAVVIDAKPYPPQDADCLTIPEGVRETLERLKAADFLLICLTNQPDVARGKRTLENVLRMNQKIRDSLPLDDLFVCLHDNEDHCACRKPKPGMLLDAARKWEIDLAASWIIGDRASDVAAGYAAGCRAIFLDFDYVEPKPAKADFTARNLPDAVEFILGFSRKTQFQSLKGAS
jgi:D-glycero-D-manno-heptose 1,7-bisphosphate phosphatase